MRWPRSSAALAAALVLVACGGRATPDDQAFHQAAVNGRGGTEVVFDATVLSAPVQVGDHEHLEVRAATGEQMEVDHNTGLAPWVPAKAGDHVIIEGQLYDDNGFEGVHCTHARTSSGCPYSGWIELGGTFYE